MSEQTYKASLEDIEAGDLVVLRAGEHYRMPQVTKVTKTQVILGEQRFHKDDGKEIGGYASIKDAIFAPAQRIKHWDANNCETWGDRFFAYMEAKTLATAKQPYVDFIDEIYRRTLMSLPLENLKQAAELLGYKAE